MVTPAAAVRSRRHGFGISGAGDERGPGAMRAGRRVLRAVCVATLFGVPLAASYAQTPASIARGKDIAQRACAGCHAIDGPNDGKYLSTDVPSFRALANRPYRTPESLQAYIMTPRHPMPAIPLELNEIRDVVDYIQSLK
jgi:mono/diheme cytochrome c family protein